MLKMKLQLIKIYFIAILLFILVMNFDNIHAQQRMQYSTQITQGFLQNPALVGVENYHDFRLLYNKQWTGYDGAPTAKIIGFSTQVGNDTTNPKTEFKTLPLIGRLNTQATSQNLNNQQTTTQSKTKVGWGAVFSSEGDGTISINEYLVMGALHIPIKKNKLSIGTGLGMAQHQFNPANIKLINYNDLTFSKQQPSIFYPTFQLGGMYYNDEFFVGLNSKQVLKTKFSYDLLSPGKQNQLLSHTILTAGLRLKSGDAYSFTTSIVIRHVKNAPSTADINLIIDYLDFVKAGLTYRTNGDIACIMSIIINHKYSVLYAYDFTSRGLRTLYSNTHNLIISTRIGKSNFSNTRPNNYW